MQHPSVNATIQWFPCECMVGGYFQALIHFAIVRWKEWLFFQWGASLCLRLTSGSHCAKYPNRWGQRSLGDITRSSLCRWFAGKGTHSLETDLMFWTKIWQNLIWLLACPTINPPNLIPAKFPAIRCVFFWAYAHYLYKHLQVLNNEGQSASSTENKIQCRSYRVQTQLLCKFTITYSLSSAFYHLQNAAQVIQLNTQTHIKMMNSSAKFYNHLVTCTHSIIQDGKTALRKASYRGYHKIVELLLKAGANPDLQDKVRIRKWCACKPE